MVEVAVAAAEKLAAEGISCGVINARWLKPMDPRLSQWAKKYPVLITAEDNVGTGGFGTAVLEALVPVGLAGKVHVKALADEFLTHGRPSEILAEAGLDAEGLATAVRKALGIKPRSLS